MDSVKFIQTERLKTAYYEIGDREKPVLIFIHGNVSSAVFYLPLMQRLKENFHMYAIDLSGFGDTQPVPVDAVKGMRQWSEDLASFVRAMGISRFSLFGWSMGGGVAMQYAIDHGETLDKLILQAPLSPYGYGGTYGPDGRVLEPAGLGSGAGCVNGELVKALGENNREFFKTVLNTTYFKPPFTLPDTWTEVMVESISKTRLGEGFYPGDAGHTQVWPYVVSGQTGICNTMSPKYCNLSALSEIKDKPDILWIHGDSDIIAADDCPCDLGYLGKIGVFPGYPGEEVYPPQPMAAQTRHVLNKYRENGGRYEEVLFDNCGHSCHLECEEKTAQLLVSWIKD